LTGREKGFDRRIPLDTRRGEVISANGLLTQSRTNPVLIDGNLSIENWGRRETGGEGGEDTDSSKRDITGGKEHPTASF